MTTDHETPGDLRYTASHEWLRRDPDRPDEATIGITDYAQDQLGDVVYVALPAEGEEVGPGAACGEIESAKTVAEFYAPVGGTVIAGNGALEEHPELVNESPYESGWLIRVRIAGAADVEGLLDAAAYRAQLPES